MQRSSSLSDLDIHATRNNRAAERSINSESLEYKTRPELLMSRKYAIDLSGSGVAPERQALLQAFKWRRFRHPRGALHTGTQGGAGKEWIVVPSLSPSEVARVDAAGSKAVSLPRSPRGGQQVTAGAIRDDGLQIDKFSLPPDDPMAMQYPEPGGLAPTRDVGVWQWRRLFLGVGAQAVWVCIPSLHKTEIEAIRKALFELSAPDMQLQEKERSLVSDMSRLQALLDKGAEGAYTFPRHTAAAGAATATGTAGGGAETADRGGGEHMIEHVVMIVVVEAEIAPILQKLGFALDDAATADLMGLAKVRSGIYMDSFKLSVLKVAESQIFGRHYSGYSQAAAVAALACRLMAPDLLLSFGTSGGVPSKAEVGEVVMADGCVFLPVKLRAK